MLAAVLAVRAGLCAERALHTRHAALGLVHVEEDVVRRVLDLEKQRLERHFLTLRM